MSAESRRTRQRKKGWPHSEGEYGHRIRIFEDPNSGILYAEMRDPARPGHYRAVSLRHRDRDRAKRWQKEQVAAWLRGEQTAPDQIPTASHVFALYLKNQTPTKVLSEQDADERRSEMWVRVLTPSKDLSKLSLREWQWFIDMRRSGAIDSRGEPVGADKREAVRDGTVASDLVFLRSVLNWATKWREDDRYLMQENPARGYSIPNERNPRRPIAMQDRFEKIRGVADQVTAKVLVRGKLREIPSYLPEILDIANGTGRRIASILALRYQDLRLSEGGPHGAICWPAATDKMKKEWTVPISREVRKAIDRTVAKRPGIGAAFLFPAPNHPSESVGIEVASAWLIKAEKLAKIEKQSGSLWHAYRRKWATERKHLPAPDVAAAGGWSDLNTLTQVYQQPDMATMERVVSEPAKLTERIG